MSSQGGGEHTKHNHFGKEGDKAVPRPRNQQKLDSLHIHTYPHHHVFAFGRSASTRGMIFRQLWYLRTGRTICSQYALAHHSVLQLRLGEALLLQAVQST